MDRRKRLLALAGSVVPYVQYVMLESAYNTCADLEQDMHELFPQRCDLVSQRGRTRIRDQLLAQSDTISDIRQSETEILRILRLCLGNTWGAYTGLLISLKDLAINSRDRNLTTMVLDSLTMLLLGTVGGFGDASTYVNIIISYMFTPREEQKQGRHLLIPYNPFSEEEEEVEDDSDQDFVHACPMCGTVAISPSAMALCDDVQFDRNTVSRFPQVGNLLGNAHRKRYLPKDVTVSILLFLELPTIATLTQVNRVHRASLSAYVGRWLCMNLQRCDDEIRYERDKRAFEDAEESLWGFNPYPDDYGHSDEDWEGQRQEELEDAEDRIRERSEEEAAYYGCDHC
jgi:hypothetical protein